MQEHCVCHLVSFRVPMCILSLGLHSNMPYDLDLGGRKLLSQRVGVQHRTVGRPFYSLWGSTNAHTAPAACSPAVGMAGGMREASTAAKALCCWQYR